MEKEMSFLPEFPACISEIKHFSEGCSKNQYVVWVISISAFVPAVPLKSYRSKSLRFPFSPTTPVPWPNCISMTC